MVETCRPEDLKQCLTRLKEKKWWKFAGGTDLMIRKRQWSGAQRNFKTPVMLISNLPELRGIEEFEDRFEIKPCTTLSEICDDARIPEYIRTPLFQMASPPIRNVATIGGNVCNAAKVADSIPMIFALDGEVVLKSLEGERQMKATEFITGKYQTLIKDDEVLYKVIIPKYKPDVFKYTKLGSRKGNILSKLSIYGVAEIKDSRISKIKLSIGALNPIPIKSESLENRFVGLNAKEFKAIKEDIVSQYSSLMGAVTDKRSTKEYREGTALKLIKVFLNEIQEKME